MLTELLKEYSQSDLSAYKTNTEFKQEVAKKREEALVSRDIIALYDVLDTLLYLEDEDHINELYTMILELSMDRLATLLEKQQKFNLDTSSDYLYARALYEHAIENYSSSSFKQAKELFLMLSLLIDINFLKGAMQIHMLCALQKIPFEQFMNKFVDQESLQKDEEGLYFITHFKNYAGEYLAKHSALVRQELLSVIHLQGKES